MYDVCCIGHITLDKVVTPKTELLMAGGTAFYFSHGIRQMNVKYVLVTSLAESEYGFTNKLVEEGTDVKLIPSTHTVYFENIYGNNLDDRQQRVLQTADAFSAENLQDIDATIFHLGPLLSADISLDLIKMLAKKGTVSLDVQGYLRTVKDEQVLATDWKDKMAALPYIDILKVNESEMEVLTGITDVQQAAIVLNRWGVKEVVITLGSKGSVIYFENQFYQIPAYTPSMETDATGCGDTYMAGYLSQRVKGVAPSKAGLFAAAMASLKIAAPGPFKGSEAAVLRMIENNDQ